MVMNYQMETSGVSIYVQRVSWERIHLNLEVKVVLDDTSDVDPDEIDFYAVNNLGQARIFFDKTKIAENVYDLHVNVTNNGQCRCVPIGTYRILACCGENVLTDCEADHAIIPYMADISRSFLYGGQNKAYLVKFYVDDSSETLPFRMRILMAGKTGQNFPKTGSFTKRVKNAFKDTISGTRPNLRRYYKFCSSMNRGKRKNTVLFLTEQNTQIASNLKAVSEKMIERGLDKQYHIIYSARKFSDKNYSKTTWFSILKKVSMAGTIFIDDHVPFMDWLKLDDDQKVIQLWHAGAGFKSSGYSRWGQMGAPAPQSCHRQYSYGIAGSRNIAHFFSEVWGVNTEQVLPTGMPRMDEYNDPEYQKKKKEELYEQFPICKGKKVILFAPTYRGKSGADAYYPYNLIDFEKLYELCGDEYVVLFKMHPWVIEDINIEEKYRDRFMDVKTYPNINDLFYFTDLLITDYSSNIFEYSLMHRPMLFFAYDKIQYSFSRGFHRPYEESAPGKVCYTFDEVLTAIREKDFEYEKVEQYVEHHFDYVDTHASDRVIDWLLLDQIPEDIRAGIDAVNARMERMMELDFSIHEDEEDSEGDD